MMFETFLTPIINGQEVERGAWTGLICLRKGTGGGLCECGEDLLPSQEGLFSMGLIC